MTMFRLMTRAAALLALLLLSAVPASAQLFRPYEPLDPAKAQSLPLTPLALVTSKGSFKLQVELADDEQERRTGLMHRSELALDRGMLFDMKRVAPVSFWMRNTFIPLDLLFIAPNGTVRFIAENAIPHDDRGVGPGPSIPVLAVLELQGGAVAHYGLKVGDTVRHALFRNEK